MITTLRPWRGLPHHLVRAHLGAVHGNRLAPLQPAEVAGVGDPQAAGGVDVEATRALGLHVRVPERLHPVLDAEGPHLEAVVLDRLPRLELDQLDLVAEPAEDPPQRLEQPDQPGRPDDAQRPLPLQQVIGLEQPGEPEVVVGVEMGDVDVVDLDEPGRVDHLPLGPLPRVDQDPAAARADQHAGGRPPRGGHGAAGAEKDDREIHGASLDRRID